MARSAVLGGRTLADLSRALPSLATMVGRGLATRDPATAQVAGILPFFVLMFASNAVVPQQRDQEDHHDDLERAAEELEPDHGRRRPQGRQIGPDDRPVGQSSTTCTSRTVQSPTSSSVAASARKASMRPGSSTTTTAIGTSSTIRRGRCSRPVRP